MRSRCSDEPSKRYSEHSLKDNLRFMLLYSLTLSPSPLIVLRVFAGLSRLSVILAFLRNVDLGYEAISQTPCLPRKEVIQPHLPIRLPCYDFTPVIGLTFGGCSLRWLTDFGYSQLPWCDGRCVQGPGTYSPRHADSRLLATPTSCGRVAAHSPN